MRQHAVTGHTGTGGAHRRSRIAAAVAVLLAAATVLGGCGTPSSEDAGVGGGAASIKPPKLDQRPSMSASGPAISIEHYSYAGVRTVAPGAKVTVLNQGDVEHTVTADKDSGASFDVTIVPGGKATFTAPTKPGTYTYHCRLHPSMHGVLTVK